MTHFTTKYLEEQLNNLDKLADKSQITNPEYVMCGLLLKIFEALNDIRQQMKVQK